MSLSLLPDFQQPLSMGDFLLYYPFEGHGPFTLLPHDLQLGWRTGDELDFSLEFIRGQYPGWPPEPHGRLIFGVEPHYKLTEALAWLRLEHPDATISPAHFATGQMRLLPLAASEEIPLDLLQPLELRWASAEQLRFQLAMSPSAASLLRQALEGELLPLQAFAELEIEGVAPRLSLEVQFDARHLLQALGKLAETGQAVSRSVLVDYFQQQGSDQPITLSRALAVAELTDFAEAMVDRIVMQFGHYVAAPQFAGAPYLQLQQPGSSETLAVLWNLHLPVAVKRRIGLLLDPFATARQIVAEKGIDSLVEERIVPYLPTGFHQLYISTNLPKALKGVISSGVRIRLPANPPLRFRDMIEEIDQLEQVDEATLRLRLSPREALVYRYSTFLWFEGNEGAQLMRGEESEQRGETLRLGVNDYPVRLASLSVDASLLALAEVRGRYRWRIGEATHEETFQFAATQLQLSLLIAQAAEDAQLAIEAVSRTDGSVLVLDDLPFGNRRLGCYSFPSYGSHSVDITCHFADSITQTGQQMFIELLPQGKAESEEEITMLYFTPELSHKTWRWFAPSPFAGGYCYRSRPTLAQTPSQWSPVQSQFEALHIQCNASGGDSDLPIPGDNSFADLLYYPDPADSENYFYIPGNPSPVNDAQGDPLLQLLIAGEIGLLQINVQWQAPTARFEALRRKISAEKFQSEPALPRLSFAPVEVERVELLLKTDDGDKLLASASSSGMPPFGALFSVGLSAEQQSLTIAALHQRAEILRIRYTVTRFVAVTMVVTLEGDVQAGLAVLDATATVADCRQWLTQAAAEGQLQLARTGARLASEAMWLRTTEMVFDQAAQWLYQARQSQNGHRSPASRSRTSRLGATSAEAVLLAVSATRTESIAISLHRETDIATWFTGSKGDEHIRVVA